MAHVLHVEVIRKECSKTDYQELCMSLKKSLKSHETLTVGRKFVDLPESLENEVEEVRICELEEVNPYSDDDASSQETVKFQQIVNTSDVRIVFHIYRLTKEGAQTEMMEKHNSEDQDIVAANFWALPSKHFHGLWDSLIFDSNIKERLLHYGRTMLSYSECGVDPTVIASNRVILLHGPPGTGKTTLCKAIAQKLSVRMNSSFNCTILVEVNTHSLFSKYFSESGKLVTKMFNKINDLVSDNRSLVCVLIDEVESLAHSRAAATSGTEPSDSIRVVNSVLTQLDLLKMKPNVLILTTSNITKAIDIAFVDRADIKQLVPYPSALAVHTIILSCLQELVRVGMVSGILPLHFIDLHSFKSAEPHPGSSEDLLIRLSKECCGLSGRALRKLPLLVHSFYVNPNNIVSVSQFVRAMHRVIQANKEQLTAIDAQLS